MCLFCWNFLTFDANKLISRAAIGTPASVTTLFIFHGISHISTSCESFNLANCALSLKNDDLSCWIPSGPSLTSVSHLNDNNSVISGFISLLMWRQSAKSIILKMKNLRQNNSSGWAWKCYKNYQREATAVEAVRIVTVSSASFHSTMFSPLLIC